MQRVGTCGGGVPTPCPPCCSLLLQLAEGAVAGHRVGFCHPFPSLLLHR